MNNLIHRHQHGDWSEMDVTDRQANIDAVDKDIWIHSSYKLQNEDLWIITEWNRSVTTLLLPIEY